MATYKELKIAEGRHSHDKCMNCSAKPDYECNWAEGMGHAWFCKKHFNEWKEKDGKGDIISVKEIKDGKASKDFSDNKNPNIWDSKKEVFKREASNEDNKGWTAEELISLGYKRSGDRGMEGPNKCWWRKYKANGMNFEQNIWMELRGNKYFLTPCPYKGHENNMKEKIGSIKKEARFLAYFDLAETIDDLKKNYDVKTVAIYPGMGDREKELERNGYFRLPADSPIYKHHIGVAIWLKPLEKKQGWTAREFHERLKKELGQE